MKNPSSLNKVHIFAIAASVMLMGVFFWSMFSTLAFVGPTANPPTGNGAVSSDASNNVYIGGNLNVTGTITAASGLGGSAINAQNVSAGMFGLGTGGGIYNFSSTVGIGIGTTTPWTALDVAGNITDRNVTASPFLATNASGTLIAGAIPGSGIVTSNGTTLSNDAIPLIASQGGTATTTPLAASAFISTLPLTGGTVSGATTFSATTTNASATFSGNVGIGTAVLGTALTVAGPISLKAPTTVTGSTYTVVPADSSLVFKTTATCTLTLPAAASFPGRILYVKTIAAYAINSASSNVFPISTATAGTAILAATAGKYAMLQSDGTEWVVMESN